MVFSTQTTSSEDIRQELARLIAQFEVHLQSGDLRSRVRALIPAFSTLRELGCSLLPSVGAKSARDRILTYFREYPMTIINGDEIMIVAGISEWARRVRELRVQFGWNLVSGETIKEMCSEGELRLEGVRIEDLAPDDYLLISADQDRDAAHRWNLANAIRKRKSSVRDRILAFLRENVGKPVTGEELRYVANNRTEWARRVRELRTEHGWPLATRNTGRPDLPVGVYVLEQDRQSPEHDRKIPDPLRQAVLVRDGYRCTNPECGWSFQMWNKADPRFLELHHVRPHARGGANTADNLVTLCTVCHDEVHRSTGGKGKRD
jgi:5-methylcytosine-specific restriction endonuclease McrA